MEQRTKEWFRARLGKITASEIYVLMKDKKVPMSEEELAEAKAANPKSRVTTKVVPFSDMTETYLNRKVMENYLPLNSKSIESINAVDEYIEEHTETNKAMRYGTFWEDTARNRYAETMGYEVLQVGFVPYDCFPNLVGASPDGMIRQENGGCEIKCPYTVEKHYQHMMYETSNDLKENDPQYYWQIMTCMLVTGCDFWDFVSFNPYMSKSKQLKVLRIQRNEEELKKLKTRIELAVAWMQTAMAQLDKIEKIIK